MPFFIKTKKFKYFFSFNFLNKSKKIKVMTNNKKYEPARIYKYYNFKDKLQLILSENDNINKAKFFGVRRFDINKQEPTKFEYGILVSGIDSYGVSPFRRFFSCDEINFLYEQLNRRLKMEKELDI